MLSSQSEGTQSEGIQSEGILLLDKPTGKTSFQLVGALRRRLKVKKIGHAGTLDPLATGVMVMLIGRPYTRLSDQFLTCDKEYEATVCLGSATDTYDSEGSFTETSSLQPSLLEVTQAIEHFSGSISQIPPMFSAKKVQGKKLCDLARRGIEVERAAVIVHVKSELLEYRYPYLKMRVACSKGTYIRSLVHDIGCHLGSFAHITALRRTKSGSFHIDQCLQYHLVEDPSFDLHSHIQRDCSL